MRSVRHKMTLYAIFHFDPSASKIVVCIQRCRVFCVFTLDWSGYRKTYLLWKVRTKDWMNCLRSGEENINSHIARNLLATRPNRY